MLQFADKQQFIRAWAEARGCSDCVTDYGLDLAGHRFVAVECHCGEPNCPGWRMEPVMQEAGMVGAERSEAALHAPATPRRRFWLYLLSVALIVACLLVASWVG